MSDLERVKQAMVDGEHTDGDLQWAVETIEQLQQQNKEAIDREVDYVEMGVKQALTIKQLQDDNIRLVDELGKQKCNAAFYKCSALCGEKFKDGDEPFPPPEDKS